ncbi:MAG: type II secretion system F family protein [Clostridia bacterium]
MLTEAIPIVCALVLGISLLLIFLPQSIWHGMLQQEQEHALVQQLQQGRLSLMERLEIRLNQSQTGITVGQYLLLSIISGATFYMLCSLVLKSWWLAVPSLIAGVVFAERVLGFLSAKKKERFEEGNIRAIRIMASSLRTSPSYFFAFEQVANSGFVEKAVAREYMRVVELLRGQVPLERAMSGMHMRTGSPDIAYMSTIVQVQRALGGDMAKTLDQAASSILRRRQLLRKQRAAMSQILAQVNLLSVMPFVFVTTLYFNNPHHFDPMLETVGGRLMILGAFFMILLGGEFIRFVALKQIYRG